MSLARGCNLVIPPPKQTLSVTQLHPGLGVAFGQVARRKYFERIFRELPLAFRNKVKYINNRQSSEDLLNNRLRRWYKAFLDCRVNPSSRHAFAELYRWSLQHMQVRVKLDRLL